MDQKKLAGIVLIVILALAFVAWSLQGPAKNSADYFVRSVVGGLLAGAAYLSWLLLVRKKPIKKS